MRSRNMSFEQFRNFIRSAEEWDGLPFIDSLTRLCLLADYFSEQTGIRFSTYAEEAWKIRFKDSGWKITERMYVRKLCHIKKNCKAYSLPQEAIYDQFLASVSPSAHRFVRETPKTPKEPSQVRNGSSCSGFFANNFGERLTQYTLKRGT